MRHTGDILIGVDGSESSKQALRWAADEARRGGGDLNIVVAYRRPGTRGPLLPDTGGIGEADAGRVVDEAVAEARTVAPGLTVAGAAVQGNPAAALLDAAAKARLVVVGSRGRGGFTSLPLGSVGLRVATHAFCSVAVVRGRVEDACGPVVVGLNGSASSSSRQRPAVAALWSPGPTPGLPATMSGKRLPIWSAP
jgi:nucleotide-binding universal stress UspA family protein